jgi:hypothetical protein
MELFRLIRLFPGEQSDKSGVMGELCRTVRHLGSGIVSEISYDGLISCAVAVAAIKSVAAIKINAFIRAPQSPAAENKRSDARRKTRSYQLF